MVWYSIVAMVFCVIFTLTIQMANPAFGAANLKVLDVVSFVLGALCQQGTHLSTPSISGRFVLMTTFVSALALFTSYSANIVSLLQAPSKSIRSLDDLVSSSLVLGIEDSPYTRNAILSDNKPPFFQRVYDKKIEPRGNDTWITDAGKAINKIRTEAFAYYVDTPIAYNRIHRTYTESEKCRMNELNLISSPMSTITVERNSGYKEMIKRR